jgi:LAS superfamily LD-carboxypeptidase LdcB
MISSLWLAVCSSQPQQEILPLVNRSEPDVSAMHLPSAGELYGLEDTHVIPVDANWSLGQIRLHPAAAQAFERLRFDAAAAGFDLRIASGFRSFARQLIIWNEKAGGMRPVLDDKECIVDMNALTGRERVFAILRWSALPGASRHHWGSDMDIYDAQALPVGKSPGLTVAETVDGGVFAALHRWLDARIDASEAHSFFRPYTGIGLGIAREPWHLSFAPLAADASGGSTCPISRPFSRPMDLRCRRTSGIAPKRLNATTLQCRRGFIRVRGRIGSSAATAMTQSRYRRTGNGTHEAVRAEIVAAVA